MTRTEELLQRAKDGFHLRDRSDIPEFVQLVELVRLQHETLLELKPYIPANVEAIAAFNKFEQGGE